MGGRARGSAIWRGSGGGGSFDLANGPGSALFAANPQLRPVLPTPDVALGFDQPMGYDTDSSNRVTNIRSYGLVAGVTATPKAGGATIPAPRAGVIYDANGQVRDMALRLTGTAGLRINGYTFPAGDVTVAYYGYPCPSAVGATRMADVIGDSVFFDASAPQTYRLATNNNRWRLSYHDGTNAVTTQGASPRGASYQGAPGVPLLFIHSFTSATNTHLIWVNGEQWTFTAPWTRGFTDLTIGAVNNTFNPRGDADFRNLFIWPTALTATQCQQLENYLNLRDGYRYKALYVFGSSIVQNNPSTASGGNISSGDTAHRNTWGNYLRLIGEQSRSRLKFRNYGRSANGLVTGSSNFVANGATLLANVTEATTCTRRIAVIDAMVTNDTIAGQTASQSLTNMTNFVNILLTDARFDDYIYVTDIARGGQVGAGSALAQTNATLIAAFSPGGSLHTAITGAGKTIRICDMGAKPEFNVINTGSAVTSVANVINETIGGLTFTNIPTYQADDPTPYTIHPSHAGTAKRAQYLLQDLGDLAA